MLLVNLLHPSQRTALENIHEKIARHEKSTRSVGVWYWSKSGQQWRVARCQRDISDEDRAAFWDIDQLLVAHLPETRP